MAAAIDGMQDILREFLIESTEGMDVLDRDLVALEREPESRELLAEIFRAVHTLKGNSGALGYSKLESVAHAGESALSGLRDGTLRLSTELISGLLAMVDALRGMLRAIEEGGSEGAGDYTEVVNRLSGLAENSRVVQADEKQIAHTSAALAAPLPTATAAGSIRVKVGLLDRLMNLVGELVLARNQVLHSASGYSDARLANAAQRLKLVTGSLQDSVMKARMQPIGSIWNQLPRLVRDMALQSGKQIVVEMKGSDIELDRSILEAIKDPLTHILRNAIDHGIETPEKRRQAGKTDAGHVHLRAFHEGGRVYVEISDDGAGIDLPRVRQRAAERGLITAEQAAGMSDVELARLVFTPGFSTAETVTNISGRGVGMDVVRTNLERIGGVVDLESVSGQGTTLKINLPLTLAILPVLIVGSGGERLAIPQASLLELVRLEPSPIEQICGAPVYRLRDRLLPLVFLDRVLHLPPQNAGNLHIAVLQAGARQFGLVVNALGDSEEILVKPLSKYLKGLGCFAGAAILGDGGVVLILDVVGVAQLANLSTARAVARQEEPEVVETAPTPARQSWVTFRGTTGSRFALPASAVARLEEIPAEKVEHSHGRQVAQYQGEILPLLSVSELFQEPPPERDPLQVLLLREADENVGLVVDRIEDIVEEAVELRGSGHRGLLQGRAVIDKRVADVLDVRSVLAVADLPVIPAASGSR